MVVTIGDATDYISTIRKVINLSGQNELLIGVYLIYLLPVVGLDFMRWVASKDSEPDLAGIYYYNYWIPISALLCLYIFLDAGKSLSNAVFEPFFLGILIGLSSFAYHLKIFKSPLNRIAFMILLPVLVYVMTPGLSE